MRKRPFIATVGMAVFLAASLSTRSHAGPPAVPMERLEAPALDVLDVSVTGVSQAQMPLPGGGTIQQSVLEADLEYTRRLGLGGPWYFALGVSYEAFIFNQTANGSPDRLQGIAGIVALQYLVEDHVAATLELRPGFYAAGEMTGRAFDVPILAYAPIPLRSNLFLVLGARYSQLQNPVVIPVGGLIWQIQEDIRLEALFPQSKLVYSPSARWEYLLQAEIAGDGFRMDRDPALPKKLQSAVVEYSEYRTGAGVNFAPRRGASVGVDAGYVFERSLDYFRANTNLRSEGSAYLRLQSSLEF